MKACIVINLICILAFSEGTEQGFYFNISDFADVLSRSTFVDKTLLIKTFLHGADQVLITAPENFGKTTNLDMLKRFLEVAEDGDGKPLGNLTENCSLFKHHNLHIYQDEDFFRQHCGKYPVLLVDFKDLAGETFAVVVDKFKAVLHRNFRNHGYLLENSLLSVSLLKQFRLYHDETYANLTQTEIFWGFRFFTEILNKHFQKEVFVLVDNFDYPSFHEAPILDSESRKTDNFIRDLMSYLLKCNPHVNRALLASCHRPSPALFVGITNIRYHGFLENHGYAPYFGFTESEVYDLVSKHNIKEEFEATKRSCDEYYVQGGELKIYNSWAVVCYLQFRS